jgi:hypothetical protein
MLLNEKNDSAKNGHTNNAFTANKPIKPIMPPPPLSFNYFKNENNDFSPKTNTVNIDKQSDYRSNNRDSFKKTPPPPINSNITTASPSSSRKSMNRIDPSQIPRPDRPQMDINFETKSGLGRKNPPCMNSLFTSIDTGNCSPRYMRSTMIAPPANKELLKQISIPYAIIATPFASPENDEINVPVVELNGNNPSRCTRCSGYVNPNIKWIENGKKWICNLCGMNNLVDDWFFFFPLFY